jgi:6-phosphogluconate dehydrogenase
MELGMIGLGRMGANMAERLVLGGHRVVGFDLNTAAVDKIAEVGVEGATTLEALVAALASPRILWLMVPAGNPVDQTIATLLPMLSPGDIIIDGGNSNYKLGMQRGAMLTEKEIHFLDVGTSGGVWGLKEGYSLMIGGKREIVESLRPIFETLAPAPDRGGGYVGPSGAGHFVKMIHNGIEYGMMQAIAEGFALMKHKTEFELDLAQIAEIWRYGSVVRSWLLELAGAALKDDPDMEKVQPFVQDSGEGRWTVAEAIDLNVAAPIITLSLLQRLRSRDQEAFGDRLLAMIRNQFGGHAFHPVPEINPVPEIKP